MAKTYDVQIRMCSNAFHQLFHHFSMDRVQIKSDNNKMLNISSVGETGTTYIIKCTDDKEENNLRICFYSDVDIVPLFNMYYRLHLLHEFGATFNKGTYANNIGKSRVHYKNNIC